MLFCLLAAPTFFTVYSVIVFDYSSNQGSGCPIFVDQISCEGAPPEQLCVWGALKGKHPCGTRLDVYESLVVAGFSLQLATLLGESSMTSASTLRPSHS